MSEDKQQFRMQFALSTIRHLGIKMYAQIPGALAELIANAYDADATKVRVNLYDEGSNGGKRIVVEDNGMGMTAGDINDKFLVIGRNRRKDEENEKTPMGRTPSGKKGLGKLALFGIGSKIRVDTKSSGEEAIAFVMDWEEIKAQEEGEYNPVSATSEKIKGDHGTVVTILDLARQSPFNQESLAKSIARFFNYQSGGMEISISVNDKEPTFVDQDMLFDGLAIEVEKKNFPPFVYDGKEQPIAGRIVTTEKPLSPGARGVALYANGRMVNSPEFFTESTSSHFYSYVIGYLVVDFVDKGHGDEDLISTNRQSLDWDDPQMEELRKLLREIVRGIENEWREARKDKTEETIVNLMGGHEVAVDLRENIRNVILAYIRKTPETDAPELFKFINGILPPKSDKKIMISHSSKDEDKASIIYRDLIARGVKPEHILYTSGDAVSRLDVRKPFEYIREFFVQHVWNKPHVIFVVSENMENSWNAVLEAGAAWVTETEHTLAVAHGYQPKPPLANHLYIAFDDKNEYQDKIDADRILDYVVKQYNERTQQKPKKLN